MKECDYVIKGDTEECGECLIYVSGTLESAKQDLERMLNNPTERDKRVMEGHTNLRIKAIAKEDCWWNHNCD